MAKVTFNIQDQHLNQFRKERVRVLVTMTSGEKLDGYLKSFDNFCLLIENDSDILLYKHAIASVAIIGKNFRHIEEKARPAGQTKREPKLSNSSKEKSLLQVQDPVCGTVMIRDHAAAVVRYHGQPHYFCGKSCRMKFIRDPMRYLAGDQYLPCQSR